VLGDVQRESHATRSGDARVIGLNQEKAMGRVSLSEKNVY